MICKLDIAPLCTNSKQLTITFDIVTSHKSKVLFYLLAHASCVKK